MGRYLKRKIWLIILASILSIGLILMEKCYQDDMIILGRDFIFQCEINVKNNYEQKGIYNIRKNFIENIFIEKIDQSFKCEKFNADWSYKNDLQKLEWLNEHIVINNIGAGRHDILFIVKGTEIQDYPYVKNNGMEFFKEVIANLENINPNYKITIYNFSSIVPDEINLVSRNHILFKYAIIGLLLGAALSTIFLIGIYQRRQHGYFY